MVDDTVVKLTYCTNAQSQSSCSAYSSYSKLASIHGDRDLFAATDRCKLLGSDCFINLNDIQREGIYTYADEILRIHHVDKDCVHLSFCDGSESVNCVLRKIPSEIFHRTKRAEINGNWDTLSDEFKKDTSENNDFVLANKLWCNGPHELIIDYIFYSTLAEHSPSGHSDITIYYYIFIQLLSNTNEITLGLSYHSGSTPVLLSIEPINNNLFAESSLLSTHLTPDTDICNIYLNNILDITYIDQLHFDELKHNEYSGTEYDVATSPSLSPSKNPTITPTTISPTIFPTTLQPTISSSSNFTLLPSNPANNPTYNPIISPTIYHSYTPTINPTSNPSNNPTVKSTLNPSNNPLISPTFNPITTANSTSPRTGTTTSTTTTLIPTETSTKVSQHQLKASLYITVHTDINIINIICKFEHMFDFESIDSIIYILNASAIYTNVSINNSTYYSTKNSTKTTTWYNICIFEEIISAIIMASNQPPNGDTNIKSYGADGIAQEEDIIYSSALSENRWKDAIIGPPANITQNYLGFRCFDQTRQLNQVTYWDAPKSTEFYYTGIYGTGELGYGHFQEDIENIMGRTLKI